MYLYDNMIHEEGFKNYCVDGEKKGFEFWVRKPGLKVVYLSLFGDLRASVDGEEFGPEHVRLSVDGYTFFSLEQMADMTDTVWLDKCAVIRVLKEGGLACGQHEVGVTMHLYDVMPSVYRTWGSATYQAKRKLTLTEKSRAELEGRLSLTVSAFCYCIDSYEGRMNLKHYMKTVADMQARGLEIIPEGSMEGFPAITNDYSARWNEWLRLYNVEPVCLASHNTINPRGRRSLSDEENIQALKDLIVYAKRMGFKMIRTNDTEPQVIEAAIPFAEQNDIYLGFEIHPPIRLDSEIISRNLAVMEKTGTKHFGFIPDTGIFAIKTPQVIIDSMVRAGARAEILEKITRAYAEHRSKEETIAALHEAGGSDYEIKCLNQIYGLTNDSPENLERIYGHIIEVHAKYYEINEDFEEPSIALKETLGFLLRKGYRGNICLEYEGHWYVNDVRKPPSQEQVRRGLHLIRSFYDSSLS